MTRLTAMRRHATVLAASLLALAACGSADTGDRPALSVPAPPSTGGPAEETMAATPSTLPAAGEPCAPDAVHRSAVVAFKPNGDRRWSAELRNTGFPGAISPVVDGNTVFTNEGGELRAFDWRSGRELWRKGVAGPVYGEWVIEGTLVALVDQVSDEGRILGLDPGTGAQRWEYKTPGRGLLGNQHPTSDGGLAMVNADDGSLAVLDVETGKVRWTAPGTPEHEGVAIAAGVVVHNHGSRLIAYDSVSGKQRWSIEAGSDLLPEVVRDVVVAVSGVSPQPAPFAGYRLSDGERIWTASFDYAFGAVHVTPAGLLIDEGPSGSAQSLVLLDVDTGRVRWQVPAQVYLSFDPVVSGDFLVTNEGVPAVNAPSRLVIRRLADGSVKETVDRIAVSNGVSTGRRAYISSVESGAGSWSRVVMVEDGAAAWDAPIERLAQRAPAPLPDGGAVVQIADAMCSRTDAAGD